MSRGGRPRDPQVAGRAITAAISVIGVNGMASFTSDEVAAAAGIGKASLYRRWPHLRDLLVDVVGELGVQLDDAFPGQTTTRDDLISLLTGACTGVRAMAEVAVLPVVGTDERLQKAYAAGPYARLLNGAAWVAGRAERRGEPVPLFRDDAILAGVAWLQQRMAVTGRQAPQAWMEDAADYVVLPAIAGLEVRS